MRIGRATGAAAAAAVLVAALPAAVEAHFGGFNCEWGAYVAITTEAERLPTADWQGPSWGCRGPVVAIEYTDNTGTRTFRFTRDGLAKQRRPPAPETAPQPAPGATPQSEQRRQERPRAKRTCRRARRNAKPRTTAKRENRGGRRARQRCRRARR